MASSELDIEPDLNKAPPHVEGDLLKQNTKSIVGKKGWKKYFFIVLRDKLLYYRRRDDHKTSKEPIGYIRMSQVLEITEVVFDGVPKKHHLNCGFSIIAFHHTTQEKQTISLLAETPEDMRYWVHALRYIKAYWSKLEVRETVLSEEQERKLLERILSEEEDERDVLVGEYTLSGEGSVSVEQEPYKSVPIVVHFADGSKVTVKLSPSDLTSDLLESVKDKLRSSAAQLWLVDVDGLNTALDPQESPAFYQAMAHRFYVLDPPHRVLVIFFKNMNEFDSFVFPATVTTREVIEDRDVSVALDLRGITNRGLFLKSDEEERIFGRAECPCEVLFQVDASGKVTRMPEGRLLIKNQSLGFTLRVAHRSNTKYRNIRSKGNSFRVRHEENMRLEEQEEEAQQMALDMLLQRKSVPVTAPKSHDRIDENWVLAGEPKTAPGFDPGHRHSAPTLGASDTRGFEENVQLDREDQVHKLKRSEPVSQRTRSLAISTPGQGSPLLRRNRVYTKDNEADGGTEDGKTLSSPSPSPSSQRQQRSRSRSPRRLPDVPIDRASLPSSPDSSFKRRNARRRNTGSNGEVVRPRSSMSQPNGGKGPTIVVLSTNRDTSPEAKPGSPTRVRSRSRSPASFRGGSGSMVANMMGDITADSSRSSTFGVTSPMSSLTPETMFRSASPRRESEDKRLDDLFSQSFQREQDLLQAKNYRPVDTLSVKLQAVSKEAEEKTSVQPPFPPSSADSDLPRPKPILIDFTRLATHHPSLSPPAQSSTTPHPLPHPTIEIHSPSLLKIVLLQASEASSVTSESRPMDYISLSGVCLRNDHGIWKIQAGCNFHDPLPLDSEEHTETFPLPGGIRAVYNHTHKRWHVLPSPSAAPSVSGSRSDVDDGSLQSSEELDGSHRVDAQAREAQLFVQKKAIVTEIGMAFQVILAQFEKTRDVEEKKRIGSDMMNVNMGHMIRGRFCSAIARLILDGMKPYRMEGLIIDDIWKITTAFCQEAQANHTSPLVFLSFDKQILQPINSLKSLQDKNIRFRTFVCLALSKGTLTDWLESLLKQRETLKKFYLPNSLLFLSATSQSYHRLYKELLLTLEPVSYLPFDLSIDFEIKQTPELPKQEDSLRVPHVARNTSPTPAHMRRSPSPSRPHMRRSPSPSPAHTGRSPSPSPPHMGRSLSPSVVRVGRSPSPNAAATTAAGASLSPSRERPSVVIKTSAATGQRTGNVINAVWQPPVVEAKAQVGGVAKPNEETDSLGSGMQALKSIQERQQPVSSREEQATPTSSTTTGWFKKLATSIQQININAGGAITGPPKGYHQQQQLLGPQLRKPPPPSSDKRVEALYNNVAEDADELSFSKGDILVVKEQINEEWLICTRGNQSGIVPVNYVKGVM